LNNINITSLDNGIKVVSEYLPYVQSFSLGFWFETGSRNENPETNGISHFLEHMFFKGTSKRSARRIADEIEATGGYLNAFTSKEHTCIYGRGLAKNMGKTFNVIADMITDPALKETEIKREKGVILDELFDIEDSPEEVIFDRFESSIYAGHELAMPIIGTEQNINKFNSEMIREHIRKNYGKNNFMIVASGNFEHSQLVKLAEKNFRAEFPAISRSKSKPDLYLPKYHYFSKETQQAHVIIGKTTAGFNDAGRTPVALLSQILGEGSSSRIFQRVREKNGMTYQINTFLNSFSDTSAFGVYYSTGEKTVEKVYNLILDELSKIKSKPVPEKELQKAKECIKGNILFSLENTTSRMMRIANSLFYHGRIKPVEETIADIDSVTVPLLMERAVEELNETAFTTVLISQKNINLKIAA